jgi:hypothetical protein
VDRFFVPAIDSSPDVQQLRATLKNYPGTKPFLCVACNFTHVKDNVADELLHVQEMLAQQDHVAVGGKESVDSYWGPDV